MEGFIYVIGISHDIVTKLIDIKYKESGVKGEQYIKKMIQIPISLPRWNEEDILELVKDFVKNGVTHDNYKDVISENIELLSKAVEHNPREIKRFLNNFIVAYEIFSEKNVEKKVLLVIQAIQFRWPLFYDLLMKMNKPLMVELAKYVQLDHETLRG